jgi:hypothetical protein
MLLEVFIGVSDVEQKECSEDRNAKDEREKMKQKKGDCYFNKSGLFLNDHSRKRFDPKEELTKRSMS